MTTGGGRTALPTAAQVRAGRRERRRAVLEEVASWAGSLSPELAVRAVVVFGSYARGDWNDTSDVDVLVVAGPLPLHPTQRLRALGDLPPRVQVVVWEPRDYLRRRGREPITVEAEASGVWVVGSPETISTSP